MKNKYRRSIFFAKLSVPTNIAMALGKLILGIISSSFFLGINALYNVGMALAKYFALKGMGEANFFRQEPRAGGSKLTQYDYYMIVGGIIISASIMYIIYCIRMFVGEKSTQYHMIVAIAIAAFTFTEIVISWRGSVVTRRDRATLIEAIKMTTFASSLISLVLTQTAILSFAQEGDVSFYNGISGILFGGIAALMGLYMVLRMAFIKSDRYHNYLKRRVIKIINKIEPGADIELMGFMEESNFARLYYSNTGDTKEDMDILKSAVKRKLNIELIPAAEHEALSVSAPL